MWEIVRVFLQQFPDCWFLFESGVIYVYAISVFFISYLIVRICFKAFYRRQILRFINQEFYWCVLSLVHCLFITLTIAYIRFMCNDVAIVALTNHLEIWNSEYTSNLMQSEVAFSAAVYSVTDVRSRRQKEWGCEGDVPTFLRREKEPLCIYDESSLYEAVRWVSRSAWQLRPSRAGVVCEEVDPLQCRIWRPMMLLKYRIHSGEVWGVIR